MQDASASGGVIYRASLHFYSVYTTLISNLLDPLDPIISRLYTRLLHSFNTPEGEGVCTP